MGLGDFVRIDLRIVRGLAYYTGIVFELFDTQGELRAICGGGRYDRLLELVGGEPLPAVGFGMGDVVLGELLADRGLVPEYKRSVDFYIVPVSEAQRGAALGLAHRVALALVETHRLDDALYAEALATFGIDGLVELVTTVGYYCLVSLTLNAFEIPLEPGMADPYPTT